MWKFANARTFAPGTCPALPPRAMLRHAPYLLASLLLTACSSSTTESASQPAPVPAATEEPPADTPPPNLPNVSFERSDVAISPGRDHHTSMIIETASGPWLYVFGGTDGWATIHNDVQRAKIGKDGKLSPFESAGRLPDPRAGHCMVKKGDRIYLFGGVVGTQEAAPSATSVVLTLDSDGQVTGSVPGPQLPIPVLHLSCELIGDNVYAVGGRGPDNKATALSARTTIGADGVASPFENMTPLLPERSHHATFVRGNNLYVFGGIHGSNRTNPADRKDVVEAEIGPDGKLGPWLAAGSLPEAISVSSAQIHEDGVYVVGGLEEGGFTNKIRRATFKEDGTLTEFTTLKATLPGARGHVHQTPVYGSFIYSVGGKNDDNESLGTIDVGRFEAPVE